MKPSEAFRKGNPLKSSEVEKARAQKSLQKYKIQTLKNQKDQKNYLSKLQGRNPNPSERNKNNSPLVSISSSNIPGISTFQKKIREAIQSRFQKSKIKEFKYENQNIFLKNQRYEGATFGNHPDDSSEDSSQKSEDMEEMKKYAYLKSESYVSIHHYHSSKSNHKRQSTILKDSYRKRKFKIVNSKSIQSKNGLQNNLTKSVQKIPLDMEQELNTLSPKETKQMQVDLKVLKTNLQEKFKHEDQKRKSLTSRPAEGNPVSFLNSEIALEESDQQKNLKTNSYGIKDTFKLKNVGKFVKNKPVEEYVEAQPNPNPINFTNQRSGRTQNQKRRLLLQRNQKKDQLQIETIQESHKKFNINHQSIPKTQNRKVFSSKKIQAEMTGNQTPTVDRRTPVYKATKQRTKTQPGFLKDFESNDNSMNHSSTEQKWKLEEISFRFKAYNEEKTPYPVQKINNFIEQNEKALKMGFSLQKAYNKILSGRKLERKDTANLDNKKTIVPKNEQNIEKMETIAHETTMNREQRSISNNKRRKLRLRTQADLDGDKFGGQGSSAIKSSNKSIRTPQHSTLMENQLKDSTKNSRERQKREFIASNYRSKQKVDRFSTIS